MIRNYQEGTIKTSANQDITSKASKSLDSSSALVSAPGANREPRYDEEIEIVPLSEDTGWYYMLLRSKDLRYFSELLSGKTPLIIRENNRLKKYTFRFTTYTYTAADHLSRVHNYTYTEAEYKARKVAAYNAKMGIDDISVADSSAKKGGGYLFVKAPLRQLNQALEMITPRRYVTSDMATRKAAEIPEKQMKDFIMVYELAPWNLRFLDVPVSEYAKNHDLVRITGGVLEGAQGYIVRINKDRKLIISLGNMTLAVSGIHSCPFEKV